MRCARALRSHWSQPGQTGSAHESQRTQLTRNEVRRDEIRLDDWYEHSFWYRHGQKNKVSINRTDLETQILIFVLETIIFVVLQVSISKLSSRLTTNTADRSRRVTSQHASQTGSGSDVIGDVLRRSSLMSASHRRHAVDVHRYRHHDLRSAPTTSGHAHFRFADTTWRGRGSRVVVVWVMLLMVAGRLDSLPFGATILEPYLDLYRDR